MSVKVLTVSVLAIWSPMITVLAEELSCALVIVKVSVDTPVTRTISELLVVGLAPVGQTVQLNGGVGKVVPVPAETIKLVPLVAGDGAVATVE